MSSGPTQVEWYYLQDTEVHGPVSLEQLSNLIASDAIPATTLVSTKGSKEWQSAGQVLNNYRAGRLVDPELPPLPNDSSAPPKSFLDQIGETLNQVAGTEKLEGFSLREMFSETFKRRTVDEMEEYLIVGTAKTTPKISEVETGWPKPWLFARFLLICGGLYLGFVFTLKAFANFNLVPGLILMGTSTVPLATLILFFELNTPRNISFYRLVVLVGFGGIISMFISLIGYDLGHLNWLGASSAGIIEEVGKLAALILIVRTSRYKYILNGMLFGAAVGTGFAIFESAGYALRVLADGHGSRAMMDTIALRGLLAPLMHIAWTAMVGAALWRVKQDQRITLQTLLNPRFYKVLFLAMFLHMAWNLHFRNSGAFDFFKEILLGAAAWFIIWGLVQQGLHQVRDEQRKLLVVENLLPDVVPPLPAAVETKN
jgi:RsiW-degrading membrane proteinase PrsW (M82 family)